MYFSGAGKAKATHAVGHVLSKLYVVNVLGKVSFFYFLLLMILTTLIPSLRLSHFKHITLIYCSFYHIHIFCYKIYKLLRRAKY